MTGNASANLFLAAGAETHMYGGGGDDCFNVGANSWVEDASVDDRDIVTYTGIQLHGGVQQRWMEGGTAYWAPFTSLMAAFPVVGSELLVTAAIFTDQVTMKFAKYKLYQDGTLMINFGWGLGGAAAIKNYHVDFDSGLGVGRIAVFSVGHDGTAPSLSAIQTFVNLALKAGFGVGLNGFDPLVLDLDGDGLELTTEQNSRVYFEFDNDGFAERTGWVREDDGLLALDANANGKIDNVTELFGNQTTSGFTMLAAHDLNMDGVIDASDAVYANLRVWRDLDQDGVTDSGELFTLAGLGISAISLSSSAPGEPTAIGGNAIARTGSFSWAGGGTGTVADVAFTINHTASQWQGDDTVSGTAALLPELKGFGTLTGLRIAMTDDAVLEGLVDDFVVNPTTDLAVLKADAEAILYRWAGVDGVVADALGGNGFDTRKLAFLEAYSGYALMERDGGGDPLLTNIAEMEALWADQVTRLTLRLVVQGPMAEEFDGLTYRLDLDLVVADTATALGDLYARLLDDLPSDPVDALAQWQAWAPLLGAMADGMVRFDNNLVRSDYIAAQLLAAMDGISQPLDFETLADALGVPNLRIGTGGNDSLARGVAEDTVVYLGNGGTDTIEGGSGQDVYIFGETIGHVTIDDEEGKPAGDRIRFAFLSALDVGIARDGDDLLITVIATSETVRVIGQFAAVVPLGSDLLISTNKGVEEIQFADGDVYEIPEIMIAVGAGTSGNDQMTGSMHSDVLQGGLGDDLLEGGDDADLYVINAGEGDDIIRDVQSTPLLRAADMLIFGDGLAPSDVAFSRQGDGGDDLLITLGAEGQSVLIEGQFAYTVLGYNYFLATNSRIESFAFRNYGDGWGLRDLQHLLIAQATTAGNDTARGFGDDDTFGASIGADLMIGMDGQDVYQWTLGAGNDVIDEQARYIDIHVGLGGLSLTLKADTVLFGEGVAFEDLVFSRPTAAPDLVITIAATGETLTVRNQFDGFQTGILGPQWFDRIEWFEFANGNRLSWKDVLGIVTTGDEWGTSLFGDLYHDLMDGGAGDDVMSGRGYGDTYLYELGDGNDQLWDDNYSLLGDGFLTLDPTPDILQLGEGIAEGDISFERDGPSIILVIGPTDERITLFEQDDYFHTGVFGAVAINRIEEIRFHGGAVWDWQELNERVLAAETTAGDDETRGFMLADRIEASAGNDILSGGDSGDTYAFGIGSGDDIIRESVSNVLYGDFDTVEFGAGVLPAGVAVSRDGDDLILTLAGGDTLTIEDQFRWDAWFTWHDVELFHFANGTEWTKADVQVMLLAATAGNDHLLGFASDDVLDGLAGNDLLEGGDGSDTYHFGIGSGHDVIEEWVTNSNVGDFDRLVFGPGVAVGDVTFSRDQNDLVVTLAGGDTVRIQDQFNFYSWLAWNDIESFEFAGGTVLTNIQVAAAMLGGTAGNDHLVGTFRSDVLDGGAGNDLLEGGDSADIYVFGLGYGQDEIRESVSEAILSEEDQLRFGPGIALEDLGFARDGDDLVITIIGTSDVLTITDQFHYYAQYTWRDIDQFRFDDGTTIAAADVQQIILMPTAGDDHMRGFVTPDILDGGLGNDLLEGGDNGDTYHFGIGYGEDEIREWVTEAGLSENDTIQFGVGLEWEDLFFSRDGDDLIIGIVGDTAHLKVTGQFTTISDNSTTTWWDVENFRFADGTVKTSADVMAALLQGTIGDDHLVGFYSNDTFDGGIGNDLLEGGRGSDLYIHRYYGGHDTISDHVVFWSAPNDRLLFGEGIAVGDVVVRRSALDADDMVLDVHGGLSSVTIKNQVTGGAEWQIDVVEFDDGTTWTAAQLASMMLAGTATAGDDAIDGTSLADELYGGAGNDILQGFNGDDRITGGLGDDVLAGEDGNDTYVFGLGDGEDEIQEDVWDSLFAENDTLLFSAGVAWGDLLFSRDGSDLTIAIEGTDDRVTIIDQFATITDNSNTTWWDVENFVFADGTSKTAADIMAALVQGTTGNDHLVGFYADDVFEGGLGDDLMEGGRGTDLYIHNAGDGHDTIADYAQNWASTADRLLLGPGITTADVVVRRSASDADDMVLEIDGGTSSVALKNQLTGGDSWTIDMVEFDDGTIWSKEDLANQMIAGAATPGNDVLEGTAGNDEIMGGGGDDILRGNGGNDKLDGGADDDRLEDNGGDDIFIYTLGGGHDVISQTGWYGATDIVKFGAGLLVTDLVVARSVTDAQDMVLSFTGIAGSVTIDGQFLNSTNSINSFQFADGSTRTEADLVNLYLASVATAGNDVVRGSYLNETVRGLAGNDTVDGGEGNDRIEGGDGNDRLEDAWGDDVFVYALGGGDDVISQAGWWGAFDIIEFGAGLSATDLVVARSTLDNTDMVLSFTGISGSITIDTQFVNGDRGIDEVRFTGGPTLTMVDLNTRFLAAVSTSGADTIDGCYLAETINGLGGNDLIRSGEGNDRVDGGAGDDRIEDSWGNDVFVYALNSGDDEISQNGWYEAWDILELGTGILAADVTFRANSLDLQDVIIAFASGGSILLDKQLDANKAIDEIRFADGTIWNAATILAQYAARQGTSGDDFIGGTANAETLNGGDGADTIRAQGGNDVLNGGDGNDILRPEGGVDTVYGGAGSDTVDVTDHGANMTIDLDLASSQANLGSGGTESWYDVENVLAGSGHDTVRGTAAANLLSGLNGGDGLYGRGGNDILIGGASDDTLDGGDGDDVFLVGANDGYDYISGGDGYDTIQATAAGVAILYRAPTGIEEFSAGGFADVVLWGGNGGDTMNFAAVTLTGIVRIEGWGGHDTITGSTGNDVIRGGTGNDTLNGGDGDDVFEYSSGDGTDTINGGAGSDTIRALSANAVFSPAYSTSVETYDGNGFANVVLDLTNSADTYDFSTVTLIGIARISAWGGHDNLTGTAGADTLVGGTGDDTLNGGAGDDVFLYGTSGDGYDHVTGGDGTDTLLATGNNVWIGLRSLTSVEAIGAGGYTGVTVWGSTSADTLDFSGVTLTGIVKIDGYDGNDILTGSADFDTLVGGSGTDRLAGGGGADILTGGSGVDTFVFTAGATGTGAAADRITDFVSGTDKIDLSAIDANAGTPADQAFSFLGTGAFSGTAGQLRYSSGGGETRLQADLDGDMVADFEIVLTGTLTPITSDFVL
ncbi:MAG TPA: calcium-binding protein [Allosphingosinicella sp.]|nr:calcium-binding protein [Allosphingosinicella sp.]